MTDAEQAAALRHTIEMDDDVHFLSDPERAAIRRAIEVLEAPELPMEYIYVPDWRADADRLAAALDQLMAAFGGDWGPAIDALIAHEKLVEADP